MCFSVTWKFRTTKSLPRQPGLLSIVTCFHLSNKCCQFLGFVTDSASVSLYDVTYSSSTELFNRLLSFISYSLVHTVWGECFSSVLLARDSGERCFCCKVELLSAFLLWLNWVAVLRYAPACVFSTAFCRTWADALISLVMYRCECWILFILFYFSMQLCLDFFFTFILRHCELDDAWKIHFFKPALKFHWKYCTM